MKYTQLGSSGLKISRLIFGGAHIGETVGQEQTSALVAAALDAGISTFYTGDDYNLGDSERFMGQALRPHRESIVIVAKGGYRVGAWTNYSKGGSPADGAEDYTNQRLGVLDHDRLRKHGAWPTDRGMSRKHLTSALDDTLKRLGTDYVDVYVPHYWDPDVPVEETLETLNDFVHEGKVRYLACSQHAMWQLYRALWESDKRGLARYEGIQTNFSLLERGPVTNEIPALQVAGVSLLAGTSDAGGLLTGEYNRTDDRPSGGGARQRYIDPFWNEAAFDAMDKVSAVAAQLGRPPREMAEAWVLAQPAVAALLIGPEDPAEFEERARAVDSPLSSDELEAVDALAATLPVSLRPPRPQAKVR
jgi:aryl-alcohol dehydrogenase-like predicted oxidoreductase